MSYCGLWKIHINPGSSDFTDVAQSLEFLQPPQVMLKHSSVENRSFYHQWRTLVCMLCLIFRSLKKRKKLGGPNKTCQWAGFNLGLPVRTRLSQPGFQSHSSHRTSVFCQSPLNPAVTPSSVSSSTSLPPTLMEFWGKLEKIQQGRLTFSLPPPFYLPFLKGRRWLD